MLYVIVGNQESIVKNGIHQVYAVIPVMGILHFEEKLFMNLTGSFCSAGQENKGLNEGKKWNDSYTNRKSCLCLHLWNLKVCC